MIDIIYNQVGLFLPILAEASWLWVKPYLQPALSKLPSLLALGAQTPIYGPALPHQLAAWEAASAGQANTLSAWGELVFSDDRCWERWPWLWPLCVPANSCVTQL